MSQHIESIEQLRARNAFASAKNVAARDDEGDALSGFSSLIINNGLLPALAFALEKDNSQHRRICDALAKHIVSMKQFAFNCNRSDSSGSELQAWLIEGDSFRLRQVAAEAMAYLAYLKRYARTLP